MIQENSGGSFGMSLEDQMQIVPDLQFSIVEMHGIYQQLQFEQQQEQFAIQQQQQAADYSQPTVMFNYNEDGVSTTDCEQSNQSAQSIQSNQDAAMAEGAYVSDASTVENTKNGNEISTSEDPFALLQGLNSDNLMQFSQQSALLELMRDHQMDAKPNLDLLPTFEEHDIGGYKFQLNLQTQRKGKSSWIYSEALNKIYIRMNEIFSIDAVYTPKMPMTQMRIRALLSFVKEVSEPVVRCQNHISKDNETQQTLRHSLLRCENPSAEYCGTAQGKNINDRYSVLIPLSGRVTPNEDNTISQTIALKFTCQNSCIGRKETAIIFLLEGMNGEILSQRVIDVKICSCPKRDKAMDERNLNKNKRKMSDDLYPHEQKIRRRNSSSASAGGGGSDFEEIDNSDHKHCDLQRTPSGGYRITAEVPNKEEAQAVMDFLFRRTAALCFLTQNHVQSPRHSYLRRLKRLNDRLHKP